MFDANLAMAIKAKYFDAAQERGIIWTMGDLAEREISRVNFIDDLSYEVVCENWVEEHEHREALQTLMGYEVTVFVYRHLNGPWGEMIDLFWKLRNDLIHEYHKKTGYTLHVNDQGLIW